MSTISKNYREKKLLINFNHTLNSDSYAPEDFCQAVYLQKEKKIKT